MAPEYRRIHRGRRQLGWPSGDSAAFYRARAPALAVFCRHHEDTTRDPQRFVEAFHVDQAAVGW